MWFIINDFCCSIHSLKGNYSITKLIHFIMQIGLSVEYKIEPLVITKH